MFDLLWEKLFSRPTAQPYFDPVIETLQILGKEHGTREAQPSCPVILSTAPVGEASRITAALARAAIGPTQTEVMYAQILGVHPRRVYTKLMQASWG